MMCLFSRCKWIGCAESQNGDYAVNQGRAHQISKYLLPLEINNQYWISCWYQIFRAGNIKHGRLLFSKCLWKMSLIVFSFPAKFLPADKQKPVQSVVEEEQRLTGGVSVSQQSPVISTVSSKWLRNILVYIFNNVPFNYLSLVYVVILFFPVSSVLYLSFLWFYTYRPQIPKCLMQFWPPVSLNHHNLLF